MSAAWLHCSTGTTSMTYFHFLTTLVLLLLKVGKILHLDWRLAANHCHHHHHHHHYYYHQCSALSWGVAAAAFLFLAFSVQLAQLSALVSFLTVSLSRHFSERVGTTFAACHTHTHTHTHSHSIEKNDAGNKFDITDLVSLICIFVCLRSRGKNWLTDQFTSSSVLLATWTSE